MLARGVVSKINNDIITIDIIPEAVCEACGVKTNSELAMGCKSCNIFNENRKKQVIALNSKKLPLKLGNIVEIYLSPANAIKAAFFFFMLPVVLFIFGYLIFEKLFPQIGDYIKALGGVLGLTLSFFIVFLRKIIIKKKDWPQLEKIVQ